MPPGGGRRARGVLARRGAVAGRPARLVGGDLSLPQVPGESAGRRRAGLDRLPADALRRLHRAGRARACAWRRRSGAGPAAGSRPRSSTPRGRLGLYVLMPANPDPVPLSEAIVGPFRALLAGRTGDLLGRALRGSGGPRSRPHRDRRSASTGPTMPDAGLLLACSGCCCGHPDRGGALAPPRVLKSTTRRLHKSLGSRGPRQARVHRVSRPVQRGERHAPLPAEGGRSGSGG